MELLMQKSLILGVLSVPSPPMHTALAGMALNIKIGMLYIQWNISKERKYYTDAAIKH
jgi:hypothetical protein